MTAAQHDGPSAGTRLTVFALLLVAVFAASWFAADALVPESVVTSWTRTAEGSGH